MVYDCVVVIDTNAMVKNGLQTVYCDGFHLSIQLNRYRTAGSSLSKECYSVKELWKVMVGKGNGTVYRRVVLMKWGLSPQ